ARDPEPMRRLRCHRRLTRAGRSADEQDHRQVELAQLGELPEPSHRAGALLPAEHVDCELLQPLQLECLFAALLEILVDSSRELVRPDAGNAHGHECTSHQALRVRLVLCAERQRLDVPALVHAGDPAGTSRSSSASSSGETTSFAASTSSTPRAAAASATTSIAAAFSSTRYTSASTRARS